MEKDVKDKTYVQNVTNINRQVHRRRERENLFSFLNRLSSKMGPRPTLRSVYKQRVSCTQLPHLSVD